MNSFVCDVERPFQFRGLLNEDVNAYTESARRGLLLFTFTPLMLHQVMTQQESGGMTDLYLESGTYVKSFCSVLAAPSCVRIRTIGTDRRLHHHVNYDRTAPKIIPETFRKEGG